MTCFVSKPSRITLVELSIVNTSYQKLPFGVSSPICFSKTAAVFFFFLAQGVWQRLIEHASPAIFRISQQRQAFLSADSAGTLSRPTREKHIEFSSNQLVRLINTSTWPCTRGTGRVNQGRCCPLHHCDHALGAKSLGRSVRSLSRYGTGSVSYTHLTLPTIYSV